MLDRACQKPTQHCLGLGGPHPWRELQGLSPGFPADFERHARLVTYEGSGSVESSHLSIYSISKSASASISRFKCRAVP